MSNNETKQMPTTDTVREGLLNAKALRVYSGRPGCACGCRGKYHEKGTPTYTRLSKKLADAVSTGDAQLDWGFKGVLVSTESETRMVFAEVVL